MRSTACPATLSGLGFAAIDADVRSTAPATKRAVLAFELLRPVFRPKRCAIAAILAGCGGAAQFPASNVPPRSANMTIVRPTSPSRRPLQTRQLGPLQGMRVKQLLDDTPLELAHGITGGYRRKVPLDPCVLLVSFDAGAYGVNAVHSGPTRRSNRVVGFLLPRLSSQTQNRL